ncbi:MAG: ATP-binding region, ATPase domain protein [Aeromicrobium sp.]|jgi:two-component system OmpR family sensor kinase|nr:ATP-binding region, ATPase domain protein [Aeromicrobium sp.]
MRDLRLPAHPCVIDPIAVERVGMNLVDNAVTHGAPPVQVRVGRWTGPAGDDWVFVEVADHGLGMPPELLADATKRFVRAPEAQSRPGSGLGLSLVQGIIVAAGGELRLCHGGAHVRHGHAVDLACPHHDGMSATVILPASS